MALEVGGGSNQRRILSDAGRDAWAGLTLGAVLGTDTTSATMVQVSRTLLDIIRDEEPNSGVYKNLISHNNNNNKKNWKSFKDRLRKAGDAWTSSAHSPTAEPAAVQQYSSRSLLSRRNSTSTPAMVVPSSSETATEDRLEQVVCDLSSHACQPQVSRQLSTHLPLLTSESNQSPVNYGSNLTLVVETVPVSDVPSQTLRSQMLRHNSSRLPSFSNHSTQSDSFNEHSETAAPSIRLSDALAAEREQIQRVVSSTDAETNNNNEVDATVTTEEEDETETAQPPVRMSLMDLLEETDRQMGWTSYSAGDVEDEEEVVEHYDVHVNEGGGGGGGAGGREHNCCVCMVRHKGAAFIPCGHTFCRLCSRELWVNRGNCPLCNGYILEILDIF